MSAVSGSSSSPTRPPESAPGAAAAIEVSHLTKVFGPRTAVADVSFTVARGEVFGFLGPNGAGKTTTVRMLGTLIAPTSGSAVVAGISLGPARAAEIRQHISIMPEAPGLYRRLTVTENLDFFARLYGLPRREQRIAEALAAVGLSDRAHDLTANLSKGLRQRAALARTLDVAAIALAAEQLGGAQRALDMAVAYAKVRQQFGRPIGSFQAIKHRCADLLLEVESLRSAVGYAAAAVAASSAELPVLAPLLKAYASEVYSHVAGENIQIHGGIGFTWEHDAHLYLKRAKASELFLGDAGYHRERLATRIGL